jgi:8-oxo-dGTP pyrophosphatase MutT (NUDIX family)
MAAAAASSMDGPAASAVGSSITPTASSSSHAAVEPSYTRQTKKEVWDAHPREDSYGCLLIAHIDGAALDASTLAATPLDRLRFLLVQRRSTGAWSNLMQELQESPSMSGAKESWWVAREAGRCTDHELDALNGGFDDIWNDDTRVSPSWKVNFVDCNASFARAKYPALQKVSDRIRATRYMNGIDEPADDANLSKLNFVIPKGQFQTASSIQRTPHMSDLTIDASVYAGAVREVVEETHVPASDFTVAPPSVAPLNFCQYPPRKVDIFLAFLHAASDVHPSKVAEWRLQPQAETRLCKWMSLAQIMAYFAQAKVYPQSYTATIIYQLIQRFGWQAQLQQMQAQEHVRKAIDRQQQQQQQQQQPSQQPHQ